MPVALVIFLALCLLSPAGAAAPEDIRTRGAVVMDAATGRVLFAKNPELRLLPASTTKLMTALLVVERGDLDDTTTVSQRAANISPIRVGLREGDRVTLRTLLFAALMRSANDAAVALAEAVAGSEEDFVDLMNRRAMALGAYETRFINANGLPGEGQHTTAYDLAKIMRQALKYAEIRDILATRTADLSTESGRTFTVRSTNKLLWGEERPFIGKTGFTHQARHCLVSAGECGSGTVIVALLSAPSRDLLWKETNELGALGARVMGNQEEPVVYLSRTDYDAMKVTKASYTKKSGNRSVKKHRSSSVTAKKTASKQKTEVRSSKRSTKEGMRADRKKTRKTSLAKKGANGHSG